MRITHLIASLELGGAETSLCALIEASRGANISHTVVSMLPNGPLRARLEAAGARVIELHGSRGVRGALLWRSLQIAIRDSNPSLVQCWMYHANLAAGILASTALIRCPVIWGIRQGADAVSLERRTTRAVILAGGLLSRVPSRIVYNSEQSAQDHERLGYSRARRHLIWNGINCDRFRPRPGARATLLSQLDLPRHAVLLGRIARYATMKDYPTMLRGFAGILDKAPDAHLLVIGPSMSRENELVMAEARTLGCEGHVHVLPPRQDIENVLAGLDILVSSSMANEGFPNTVAEALACGTLVLTTDVGERRLLQGVHRLVPPGDAEAVTKGLLELIASLSGDKQSLGNEGRAFILANFDVEPFAGAFISLWETEINQPS